MGRSGRKTPKRGEFINGSDAALLNERQLDLEAASRMKGVSNLWERIETGAQGQGTGK